MSKQTKKKRGTVEARPHFERKYGRMTLGRALRAIRTTDDATLAVFATRLGVSVQHLSDIEKGRRVVSAERVARWAKLLRYPAASLVELALQAQLDAAGIKGLRARVEAA